MTSYVPALAAIIAAGLGGWIVADAIAYEIKEWRARRQAARRARQAWR
jgi:hypothetical protein